nr:NAD(P)-dependent oxidoreductase [Mesorhizobium sp.]
MVHGQIAGAALDVFDQEPPKTDDPLFSLPNVLCTPHVPAWTTERTQAVGWHAAKNLWAMMSGEGQADIVNPQAKQRRTSASPRSARCDFGGCVNAQPLLPQLSHRQRYTLLRRLLPCFGIGSMSPRCHHNVSKGCPRDFAV